jgi:hypothetical protein
VIEVWGVDIEPEDWPKRPPIVEIGPLLRREDLMPTQEEQEQVALLDLADIVWH